jgi:serine/threonine protein kinase
MYRIVQPNVYNRKEVTVPHSSEALPSLMASVSGLITVNKVVRINNKKSKTMNAFIDGTIATEGAGLTYQEVLAAGPERQPLAEVDEPNIYPGVCSSEAMVEPFDGEPASMERLYLVKSEDPDQAYKLIGKPAKPLNRGAGWGEINYAVTYPQLRKKDDTVLTFRAPDPREAKLVAVKKLNKMVVRQYLAQGGHEDPFKEVSRMQTLGDGIHVLECLEALEDDRHLFIVMPFCHGGSLKDAIPWRTGYSEEEAKKLFKNIVEILLYLERHGIFHHDLSPDNFLFFNGRLVLFDFAMSIRIPREANGNRYLMPPQGVYGTMPTTAPEIYFNQTPFDGVGADLWGAAVILYSLLTGYVLYYYPHPTDILFRYYILAGGLRPGLNEEMVEILEAAFQPESNGDQENLMTRAMANLSIPPDALELLINLLSFNPASRWTLMQTVESAWIQGN